MKTVCLIALVAAVGCVRKSDDANEAQPTKPVTPAAALKEDVAPALVKTDVKPQPLAFKDADVVEVGFRASGDADESGCQSLGSGLRYFPKTGRLDSIDCYPEGAGDAAWRIVQLSRNDRRDLDEALAAVRTYALTGAACAATAAPDETKAGSYIVVTSGTAATRYVEDVSEGCQVQEMPGRTRAFLQEIGAEGAAAAEGEKAEEAREAL